MIVKLPDLQTPVIDGLIMIDCWQPSIDQHKTYTDFYISLLAKLLPFDFKCVVNAAYNIALNTQDPSIHNVFERYYWPNSSQQNLNLVNNLVRNCAGKNQTSIICSHALMQNKNSVMLLEFEDFIYHWQNVLDCKVNNWLVVGQAWKNCVHGRQIGLDSMYRDNQHQELNFYALPNGFRTNSGSLTTHEDFSRDDLPWASVENLGYKLVTRNNGHWTQSMEFYRPFMNQYRISIEIHYAIGVKHLIPSSDEMFHVTAVEHESESWQFNYSKFAGAYQLDESDSQKNIKIWVFDITEPLHLETLMSHTIPTYSSFMTENQKIVIFETSRITSTHQIENFVK